MTPRHDLDTVIAAVSSVSDQVRSLGESPAMLLTVMAGTDILLTGNSAFVGTGRFELPIS
jgi:hypothetical protein